MLGEILRQADPGLGAEPEPEPQADFEPEPQPDFEPEPESGRDEEREPRPSAMGTVRTSSAQGSVEVNTHGPRTHPPLLSTTSAVDRAGPAPTATAAAVSALTNPANSALELMRGYGFPSGASTPRNDASSA